MTAIIAISSIIGVVLGLRFKVLVLIPATFLVMAVGIVWPTLELSAAPWPAAAAIVALQFGYLLGIIALHRRNDERFQPSGAPTEGHLPPARWTEFAS